MMQPVIAGTLTLDRIEQVAHVQRAVRMLQCDRL